MTEIILHNLPWAVLFIFILWPLIMTASTQGILLRRCTPDIKHSASLLTKIMQILITVIPLLAAGILIFSDNYSEIEKVGAFSLVGVLIKQWIKK